MQKFACFIVLLSSIVFTMSGCVVDQEAKKPDETIHYSSDVLVANSLEDMIEKASCIVVGKYEELEEKINSARHPDDPKKEDPDNYQETHVYTFSINESIKGDISENTIRVNKAYQFNISDPQTDDLLVRSPDYYEPDFGKTYMLFLEKIPSSNSYSGSFINYEVEFDSYA